MTPALPIPRRAGFVSRLAAFVIDSVLLALALRTTQWMLEGMARNLGRLAPPVDLAPLVLAVWPVVIAAYLVIFWITLGQTPGKWLLGLRVVAAGGGRMRFGQALLRVAGYILSALPCYLGFVWVLGPQRRAWHDRLAGTEVVYVVKPERRREVTRRLRQRLGLPGPPAASLPATTPSRSQ
jgi:uncharacterized RDD family membrane protein YckC